MNQHANLYQQALAPFHLWLSARDLSEETLMKYNLRVMSYLQFCAELRIPESRACCPELANAYVTHLLDSTAGPAKINQSLAALSRYFEFKQAHFPQIARVPNVPQRASFLTEAEVSRLFDVARLSDTPKSIAILVLCFYAGLTAGDCSRLNIEDIKDVDELITISVQRTGEIVELASPGRLPLRNWLNYSDNNSSGPMFLNCFGRRISRIGIDYLIKCIGIKARVLLSARRLSQSGKQFRH